MFTKKTIKTEVAALSVQLKQQSTNALNTFHKVMEDLKTINELSKAKQAELTEEVNKINLEISDLEGVTVANTKVISNIEKILS